MRRVPTVILRTEFSCAPARAVFSGMARYARRHGVWAFLGDSRGSLQSWPRQNNGVDGIVVVDREEAREASIRGIPTVFIGPKPLELPGVVSLIPDASGVATAAAEHLLECGFRHFACCRFVPAGPADLQDWGMLADAFCERIAAAGCEINRSEFSAPTVNWAAGLRSVAQWLNSLPKPVGVMACNDECGRWLMDACRRAGLGVPDTVGIVGADNDEVVCGMTDPPLSSVAVNFECAGFEAAAALREVMRGTCPGPQTVVARVAHVAARRSTDFLAVDDLYVAKALRFIRERAREVISVRDVAEAAALSRRALEKRFRNLMGRSILDEIRRVRTDQIARMLLETNLPVAEIADSLGFADTQHIARYFRAGKRMNPAAYRSAFGTRQLPAVRAQFGDSFPQSGVVTRNAERVILYTD